MPDRKLKPSEVIYRYKEVEVGGSLKSHRIVLIFENIITQFRRAVLAIEQKDVPMRADAVSKSLKILGTLRQELDFDAAPELAAAVSGKWATPPARQSDPGQAARYVLRLLPLRATASLTTGTKSPYSASANT